MLESTRLCPTAPLSTSFFALSPMPVSRLPLTSSTSLRLRMVEVPRTRALVQGYTFFKMMGLSYFEARKKFNKGEKDFRI